jgi:hypothetical protein
LEGGGVREGHHVGFLDFGESGDGGAVEAHAFFEGVFQFPGVIWKLLRTPSTSMNQNWMKETL